MKNPNQTMFWSVQETFHWLQSMQVSKYTYSPFELPGQKPALSSFAEFLDIRHPPFAVLRTCEHQRFYD